MAEKKMWKYQIPLTQSTEITFDIPGTTAVKKVFATTFPDYQFSFWVEVNPSEETLTARTFILIPTGRPIPKNGYYSGTAIADSLVLHLYELRDVNSYIAWTEEKTALLERRK